MGQSLVARPAQTGGIAIVDFGSQVTQLIARRVREGKVFSEIFPPDVTEERIASMAPRGVILAGGPASVYGKDVPRLPPFLKYGRYPLLGICYGMQLIAHELGGRVSRADSREYGPATVERTAKSPLFAGLPRRWKVWMSHGDSVYRPPAGFRKIAKSANSPFAAIDSPGKKIYGVQFHPEVAHTQFGAEIIRNFVFRVCACKPDWTMEAFARQAVEEIRRRVGREKVLCAISGGVDSSVTAALVGRAVGGRLVGLFIDNGLLRHAEGARVMSFLKRQLGVKVRMVPAQARFLRRLKGVANPEEKRRRIGREFVRVFEEAVKPMGPIRFLAQGTLYPDVIESMSTRGPSATIKTHHNVGGLPKRMRFELVEPLRELFKDEVRKLGGTLGLPADLLGRHPFPGPGLAVRVIGPVTEERLAILRKADAVIIEELKRAGQYPKVWQAFGVLLPVKSVGVMGDERTYANVIAVRAVTSQDGMTADWARLDPELLGRMASRIINEVAGVNRVVYDVSSKPPSTIEWE